MALVGGVDGKFCGLCRDLRGVGEDEFVAVVQREAVYAVFEGEHQQGLHGV